MMWVIFAILAAWMLGLTLIISGLVRHIATLQLGREAGPLPILQPNLEAGPEIGSAVPVEIQTRLLSYGRAADVDQALFIFSPGCGVCLEVADVVANLRPGPIDLLFVILGPTVGPEALEIRSVLKRTSAPIVEGDDARAIMREFHIGSVPYALRLRAGTIVRRKFLRRAADAKEVLGTVSSELYEKAVAQ
jgi:hypothetical protein